MNFIDIASWQAGIDLEKMFRTNPLDGVIIKATQGTQYVNTEYNAWIKWLTEHDKLTGVYHFANGQDAKAEAKHFYSVVKPVIGKVIPILDYEADALKKGTGWVKQFVDAFREMSGATCMIYCSLSVIHDQNWKGLTECPLWIAQYADNNDVYGFLETPWQKGNVVPFPRYWMHQYTSHGHLNSWSGRLDLNKFYGTAEAWKSLCTGNAPAPTPTYKPVTPEVCLAVLHGDYKTGTERQILLREAGYDPTAVQKKINELYVTASKVKADIGDNMDYINSILWIVRS